MNLFHCEAVRTEVAPDPTAVHTPLGVVRVAATSGGVSTNDAPAHVYSLDDGERVVCWQNASVDLEVLICRPLFSPPLDLPVEECWGVLWRGRARTTVTSLILSAVWEDGCRWHDGGPDGGQYLYAWTWTDGQTEVTIGTQDDERLALRAQSDDYLPAQWEKYFIRPRHHSGSYGRSDFFEHPVHYQLRSTGIACPLPPLEAGQSFQITFAVVWASTLR